MNGLDFNSFRQLVADYAGTDVTEITGDTDVYDDLFLDSLGLFGLGSEIADTYRLNVPLSLVASVSRVGEIFDLLNEKGTPFGE